MKRNGVMLVLVIVLISVWVSHGAQAGGITHRLFVVSSDRRVNDTATERYLAIVRTMLVHTERNVGAIDNAMDGIAINTRTQCPAVAAGSSVALTRWRVEAVIAEMLAIAGANAEAVVTSGFLESVVKLRWRDPRVTSLIQRTAKAISSQSHLPAGELCRFLRQWAHSQFRRLPSDLVMFSRRVASLSEMSNLLPNVLTQYEDESDVGSIRRLGRLEQSVSIMIRIHALKDQAQILSVIGLRSRKVAVGQTRQLRGHRHGASSSAIPAKSSKK